MGYRRKKEHIWTDCSGNRDAVRSWCCRSSTRISSCWCSLTTTFTASQGLLLMIPNLYKVAGEQLPEYLTYPLVRFRHALNIFEHHSTFTPVVRLVQQCCESSVQEVSVDLTPVAHCSIKKRKTSIHQLRWILYITRDSED